MREFPMSRQPQEAGDHITYSVDFTLQQFQGATLVVGSTVFLSDEGVAVLASTDGSYDAVNADSFRDAEGDEVGGMYGRDDSGQNVIGFRVIDAASKGDDTLLEIASTSTADATAAVTIQANRTGESTDTYISLERGASSEIDLVTADNGRVRVRPRLQLLSADLDLCDVYIKGSNFILKYNDGGTTRYKYLDLSGTGVTWAHSTTEP